MSTFKLYYGNGANDLALKYAESRGIVHPQRYGTEKLSIDKSKELIAELNSPPVYEGKKLIIVGPLDHARLNALEPLLKHIEDGDCEYTEPVFWSNTLEGVNLPFLSRCEVIWSRVTYKIPFEKELKVALIDKHWPNLHKLLQENSGFEYAVASYIMSHSAEVSNFELCSLVRKLSKLQDLQYSEILSALYKKL